MLKNNSHCKQILIVMYHFIREIKSSRYTKIKGLEFAEFKEQVKFLKKNYHICCMGEVIDALENNTPLPCNSALLTFDDGYKDHFDFCFPFLDELNISGCFFPSAKPILEHKVLDLNKIHLILAAAENEDYLLKDIFHSLDQYREEYILSSNEELWNRIIKSMPPTELDNKNVTFVKRLLQRDLDESVRNRIIDDLLVKYIDMDEESLSKELYMNIEQIKCMNWNGMHVGSHGYNHYYYSNISRDMQEDDIKKSMEFLKLVGTDLNNWTMCYPYGDFDKQCISLLTQYNCKLAFRDNGGVGLLEDENRYSLERFDTRFLSKKENGPIYTEDIENQLFNQTPSEREKSLSFFEKVKNQLNNNRE